MACSLRSPCPSLLAPLSPRGRQPFEVEDVTDCTILLLDHCDQVQVDNAQRTRLFIGACV